MPKLKLTADRLDRIVHAPMAMRPDAMEQLAARIVTMEVFDEPPELKMEEVSEIPEAEEAKVPRLPKTDKAIAMIPIYGGIAQHRGSDYWGGVFTEELQGQLARAVAMENVGAVVLTFDSPGGIVYGVGETAKMIAELRQQKPIYGMVKAEAASAAYWLASSTTKLFANPSAKVGSIGVWTMHINAAKLLEDFGVEISLISAGKYKVEGHPFGPLEDEAREFFQSSVDRYYDAFLGGVAAGRDVSKTTVRNDFGEGRMLDSETAKSRGMIDGIATFEELLAGIMKPRESGRRRSMSASIALADSWDPEVDA